MKKHVVIITILLILSMGATALLGHEIDTSKNDVKITENVIFGDKSVANGITVSEQTQYADQLFWNTEYKIANEPYINTEYKFHVNKQRDSSIPYRGLYVSFRDGYGCDFKKTAEEQSGIAKAYKELFDETPAGEERSKTVWYTDYYEYYPVSPNIDIPELYWSGIVYEDLMDNYRSEKAVHDRFSEFFRIPMLPGEATMISVGKDIHGNLTMTGSGNPYSDDEYKGYDSYSPQTVCAYNENVCYFSFSNRTDKGNAVDTSLIEGGYGIYKINYKSGKYKDENGYFSTGIDAASLSTCFKLDEEYSVIEMWLSDDGAYLFCILIDTEGNTVFTQIDTLSMEAVANIPLKRNASKYGIEVYSYEDFSAVLIEDHIIVLAPDAKGNYELRLSVPISEYVSEGFKWLYESAVMDYNGERLVVAGNLPEKQYHTYQTCDFYIAVYGESGIEFYAEYTSSLSVNSYSGSYKANCHPVNLRVKWN